MTGIHPRRSVLSMPGSDPRAPGRARSLPAEAAMVDPEDAAAPEARIEARAGAAAVRAGFGHRAAIAAGAG